MLSFTALYGALLDPMPELNIHRLIPRSIFNMDITGLRVDPYENKPRVFVPWITTQEFHADPRHFNVKSKPKAEDLSKGSPFMLKLLTIFSAQGQLLPLVCMIPTDGIPADSPIEDRIFKVNGFGGG